IRVWVAGCASGEEAYSIAILLREYLDETRQDCRIQIYSTDIDEDAITTARAGRYPPNILQDVEPERLRRFFVPDGDGYRVKKEIRETVVFAVQSVVKDPPFSKLDLLSCRNLLIYVKPELQQRLIPAFHFALKPGGVLFLSTSESLGSHPELFTPLSRKWKLYRSTAHGPARRGPTEEAAAHGDGPPADMAAVPGKEEGFARLTDQLLLQLYAPASVITDLRGNILYVHGETGKYLRPGPGQPTLNVVDMAHEELQLELRAAIHRAAARGTPTLERRVSARAGGDFKLVSFSVRRVTTGDSGDGLLLLSFQPVAPEVPAVAAREGVAGSVDALCIQELERDLAYTRENLHATIEEQQTSNEELKSTNEEMQSTNEELQSTNEELETSTEELQSVNEELVTVNGELEAKIAQLAGMQNDMKNLLDNINIGTIFLDTSMVIRRFTHEAAGIYHLVASDVGRPLSNIKTDLEGEDLLPAAQAVLDSLIPHEREVRTARGTWFVARIQPYRTLDNVVDGVVLTFVDITEMKRVRQELQEARELAEGIVDTVREPLVVLNGALQVVSASRSFYQHFRVTPAETEGRRLHELGDGQWDIAALRELLEGVVPRDRSFDGYVVEHEFPGIGRARLKLSGRRIVSGTGGAALILLAIELPGLAERAGA
ncbi:MAG: CheR family methyltransferase, partial [Candidatus Eisenbacteria bacterium]